MECREAAGGVPDRLGETLCAFANMPQEGIIVLGVSERQGFAVTGVDNPSKLEKSIVSVNRNAVDPAPQLRFFHIPVDSKDVVIVEVVPLLPAAKPARFEGIPYLRQADGDYVMNPNDLRMLALSALTESEQPEFDFKILPGTDTAVLDQEVLQNYVSTIRQSRTRISKIDDDDRLLQMTNVCDSEGNLRLAGLYALGFLPQSTEPALGATAAVRLSREEGGGRNRNLTEIEGPLPAMLEEGMNWIRRNSSTTSKYNSQGNLVDTPEFPPTAIREVLANALVHRDLGPSLDVGKKVEIRITDHALIVKNPGGLRGLSLDQLESRTLTKAAVNQRLYEIARYIRMPDGGRVIEGEGGGIQEILVSAREARLPKPRFINTGVDFTVIFRRGSRFTPEEDAWLAGLGIELDPTSEDLLVTLRSHGPLSIAKILQIYLLMSEKSCATMLDSLSRTGLIERENEIIRLANTDEEVSKPNNESFSDLAALGKNVPTVFAVLADGEFTVRELQEITKLSDGQVRYALAPLLERKIVRMNGGQGSRKTTYSLREDLESEAARSW
nr:ATP-binding protein [Corynebacterium pilosum]